MNPQEIIESKILHTDSLSSKLALWKFKEQKIVFTNGCFDLLHLGHIDYLCKAAMLGDILIVGVNADESVSKLKGSGRPLNPLKQRMTILASLFFVNAVIPFGEDTPYELIRKIQPQVLVKGGDYTVDRIVGADIVTAAGGFVHAIPLLAGYSTTLTEEKIKKSA